MENINILELNSYSIFNVDYKTISQNGENSELYVEDSFIDIIIKGKEIEAIIQRKVFFEPEHMFCMSVGIAMRLIKVATEKRKLKDIDMQELKEEVKYQVAPILNRASLIISAVTSQALGLPLITPSTFIEEKFNL